MRSSIASGFLIFDGCVLKMGNNCARKLRRSIPPARRNFARPRARCWDRILFRGNKITTLVNGDQIFPAMLRAIRSANRSINFETYVFRNGELRGSSLKPLPSGPGRSEGARYSRRPRDAENGPGRIWTDSRCRSRGRRNITPFCGPIPSLQQPHATASSLIVDGKTAFDRRSRDCRPVGRQRGLLQSIGATTITRLPVPVAQLQATFSWSTG